MAAGAIAEKWLKEKYNVEIVSWVSAVGDIVCPESAANIDTLTREQASRESVCSSGDVLVLDFDEFEKMFGTSFVGTL